MGTTEGVQVRIEDGRDATLPHTRAHTHTHSDGAFGSMMLAGDRQELCRLREIEEMQLKGIPAVE